ncbi:hypothetical protein LCGC14_2173530 [marine sediment metagenome]|uniref:Formyl transferase N-terminal domain-containing protein n=1 Tax=marine sediment metagenome TaxID=412755 RepID=A0A0F9DP80_9ZZZZ
MTDVVYFGGKQAGCVGLLTVLSFGCTVKGVVSYDVLMSNLASALGYKVYDTIKHPDVAELLTESDLLVSVHCREIVPQSLLDLPRLGSMNVHPCLYKYKGSDPIQRLLKDGGKIASVGIHRMTAVLDAGEVLTELYVNVEGKKSEEEIYNTLYPYYSLAILESLKRIMKDG